LQFDVKVQDQKTGRTLLHTAAKAGHTSVVEYLLSLEHQQVKQMLDAKDKDGWTALHLAAFWRHPETIKNSSN